MSKDVTLTAALRTNLLSLQGTQKLMDSTQLRLATGKKVNGALDNANAFFASQSLTNRANDLSRLLDGMGQSIQVLKAADEGIKSITSYLEQMQAVAQEALDQANAASDGIPVDNVSLAASFDELRTQLDGVAGDSGYRGTNLLDSGTLEVTFNEDSSSTLTVTGVDFSTGATGLNIGAAAFAAGTAGDPADKAVGVAAIEASLTAIKDALTDVRAQARSFGTNLNIIQTRQDFTQNLINTLKEGSDKLVLADNNEEGAKLLALQTQQQLGITSLSMASQAQQAVLRLF
ncbi:MAG: flagellin [Bdellovibrionales bacterium]|jgi:flagellin-like hook-associated protein FlgL|nr:flagellin [Bdellovibrionales bacterium]